MRENKFRSWNDFLGVFAYFENGKYWYDHDGKHFDRGFHAFDWDIAEQYTGIEDWYENDILQDPHFVDSNGKHHYLYHVVMWSNKYHSWMAINVDNYNLGNFDSGNGSIMLWVYVKNSPFAIVCTNIHENKELLK